MKARDLSVDQFAAALKRHGMELITDAHGDPFSVHIPHGGITILSRMMGVRATRRQMLQVILYRAEKAEQAHDEKMIIKAAWDAEFSQPIEPNFVRGCAC